MEQEFKHRVLGAIPIGKEYATTGKELAASLQEHDTRAIRLAIQELISDGIPICSSTKAPAGYFVAKSREEVNENLKVLKYGYGSEIFRHYRNLSHARNRMFPQLGLKI
jgi:hypothetical protein